MAIILIIWKGMEDQICRLLDIIYVDMHICTNPSDHEIANIQSIRAYATCVIDFSELRTRVGSS